MQTLTPLEKWSYAVGNMPFSVKDAAFVNFVVFYYTQVHGLSGTLAGLAMFIAVSWDAITDPLVGSWSDGFRSRWGRRHPLLLAGGLPTALCFLAVFSPPGGMGQAATFAWLTGSSMLLRTFLTVYFIPYSAMGAELSTDYDERTLIAKARVTMGWLAAMLLPAAAFAFIFQGDGGSDGRLLAANYHAYGVVSALLAALALLFCVWGTRSVIPRLPVAAAGTGGLSLRRTAADLRTAFGNHNFRATVGTNLAFGMAAGVYYTLSLYLGTYFWEFSSAQLAGLVVPTAAGTLLAFTALGRIGLRFDKPVLLYAGSLVIAFNTLWFIGLRLLDALPANGHPLIYPLQCLNTVLAVFTVASLQIIAVSLLADILDENEVQTGKRQEGVFFAAGSFVSKASSGMGSLLGGVVIDVAGIRQGSQPGEVTAASLSILGWSTVVLIGGLALAAFYCARHIRLGRAEYASLRRQLEARSLQAT